MAIKTISQPALRTPSNPFSRILAVVRGIDEWLSPARHVAPDQPSAVGLNASSELWMPLFMVPGAVQLTPPGLAVREGVRK